jgi:hypothetical protein
MLRINFYYSGGATVIYPFQEPHYAQHRFAPVPRIVSLGLVLGGFGVEKTERMATPQDKQLCPSMVATAPTAQWSSSARSALG